MISLGTAITNCQRSATTNHASTATAACADSIVSACLVSLGARAGVVALLDSRHLYLEIVASRGYTDDLIEHGRTFDLSAPIPMAEAARLREPLYIRSQDEWIATGSQSSVDRLSADYQACAALPLVVRGLLIGVIGFSFSEKHSFEHEERNFLVDLAGQAVAAIEQAQRLDELAHDSSLKTLTALTDERDRAHRFAMLVENGHDFVCIADLSGRVVYVNATGRGIVGLPPSETGHGDDGFPACATFADFVAREDWEAFNKMFSTSEPSQMSGLRWHHEVRFRHFGGAVAPLMDAMETIICSPDTGEPRWRAIIGRDVTELRAESTRTAIALEAARIGAWNFDLTTRMCRFSSSCCVLFGRPGPSEGPMADYADWIHPEDFEQLPHIIQEAADSAAGELRNEVRAVWPDGEMRRLEYVGRILHNTDGRPVSAVGVARDITHEREVEESVLRAERDRAESENRFRDMADSAHVLVWLSDSDGKFVWLNQKWLSFTGRTIDQEFGNGWMAGVHPDDVYDCMKSYLNSFDDRQQFQMEYRLRRYDGEYRWILDSGTPRFARDGTFLGYIGSCVDVTERRMAENMRAAHEAQLKTFLRDVLFAVTEGRLRLCDSEDQLPACLTPIGSPIPLATSTLADVRRAVREAGEAIGFPADRCSDLTGAASECAMNAVQHGGGEAEAFVCASDDSQRLQVWVRDHGHGIDVTSLPKATLMKGYSGGGGFGHGFFMTLQFVDVVYLLTGPEGTTVVIEQASKPIDPLDVMIALIGGPTKDPSMEDAHDVDE